MNSFRLFLIEQENKKDWYESIPMPTSVGNATMVAGQFGWNYANNSEQIQETHGQVIAGRGFPMSQGAANALSIVPNAVKPSTKGGGKNRKAVKGEQTNIGPMVWAFDWIVNRGLFEALQIRRKLAAQATQDLKSQLGDQEFEAMVRGPEITEDMVYSKAAHQAIPALGEWFNRLDDSVMEPKSLIRFPSGGKKKGSSGTGWRRISLDDINGVIEMLNEQGSGIELEKFKFGGTDGFIEWIEDGPWAEKVGTQDRKQPWRTRHGVSLHDARMTTVDGQRAYQMGGIITPLRNLDGSYQKKMRGYVQGLLAETSRAIQGKTDMSSMSPEAQEHVKQLTDLFDPDSENVLQFNFDFSQTRGYTQGWPGKKDPGFGPDEAADYAAHVIMIRADFERRAEAYGRMEAGESPDAIGKDLGVTGKQIAKWYEAGEGTKVTPENLEQRMKEHGVAYGKDHYKTGEARLKYGTTSLRTSSTLNLGHSYLQHLSKSMSMMDIIKKYLGDEIRDGKFDIEGQERNQFLKELAGTLDELSTSATIDLPKFAMGDEGDKPVDLKDAPFGDTVSDWKPITPQEIESLMANGWHWSPDRDGGGTEIEDGWKGKLMKDGKIVALSREKSKKGDKNGFMALQVDDSQGKPATGYSTDVPMIYPGTKMRYGNDYVASQAGSGSDMQGILKDMEDNPKAWGYGIADQPESIHHAMRQAAAGLIQAGRRGDYNQQFADKDPATLGGSVLGHMMERMPSAIVMKYGELDDADHRMAVIQQMTNASKDHDDLPNMDTKLAPLWYTHVKNLIQKGNEPQPVEDTGDYSQLPQGNEVPQKVLNAFTVAAAKWRSKKAKTWTAGGTKKDQDDFAGGFGVARGKEGDEKSLDGQVGDDSRSSAEDRMAKAQVGRSQNSMHSKLGVDRYGGGLASAEDLEQQRKELGFDDEEVSMSHPVRDARGSDDPKYQSGYRHTSDSIDGSPSSIKQAIASIPSGNSLVPAILGRMDAAADGVVQGLEREAQKLNMLKSPTEEEMAGAVEIMRLGMRLDRRAKNMGDDIKLLPKFLKALGNKGIVVHRFAKAQEDSERSAFMKPPAEERPAAQQATPTPQQPTAPNLQASPQVPPTAPQAQMPAASGGLKGIMARRRAKQQGEEQKEHYSFRTRYLRKLAEMAATGVVHDPSKKPGRDFEGNWEGAAGDPLGVSIKGSVEDRQTNPDGTKDLKRGKRKKWCSTCE